MKFFKKTVKGVYLWEAGVENIRSKSTEFSIQIFPSASSPGYSCKNAVWSLASWFCACRCSWVGKCCTDKAWVNMCGYVINQKSRIWSAENPHVLHKNPCLAPEDAFCFAVPWERYVGPLFLEWQFCGIQFHLFGQTAASKFEVAVCPRRLYSPLSSRHLQDIKHAAKCTVAYRNPEGLLDWKHVTRMLKTNRVLVVRPEGKIPVIKQIILWRIILKRKLK